MYFAISTYILDNLDMLDKYKVFEVLEIFDNFNKLNIYDQLLLNGLVDY